MSRVSIDCAYRSIGDALRLVAELEKRGADEGIVAAMRIHLNASRRWLGAPADESRKAQGDQGWVMEDSEHEVE